MKKVVCYFGITAMVTLAAFNVFTVLHEKENSNIPSVTVDATAGVTATNGVENCDILKYVRNAAEAWQQVKIIDGYITINGEVRYVGNVGGGAEVNIYARVPVCEKWDDNCCAKSHLDQDVRIP